MDDVIPSGWGSELKPPSSLRGHRKSPSRQSISKRRSLASIQAMDAPRRTSTLAETLEDVQPEQGDDAGAGPFSLAHELAAALMPEPSVGSRLLAEEFGIEFEEGAEEVEVEENGQREANGYSGETSTAEHSAWHTPNVDSRSRSPSVDENVSIGGYLAVNGYKSKPPQSSPLPDPALALGSRQTPKEENLLDVLQKDLASTESFIKSLRCIDSAPSRRRSSLSPSQSSFLSSISSHEPSLEQAASRMIRRINETTREREEQVRELRYLEKEFRRISIEVGGVDRLGDLEALQSMAELLDDPNSLKTSNFSPSSARNSWSDPSNGLLADVDEEQEDAQEVEVVDEPDDYITRGPDSAKEDPSLQPVPLTGPPDPSNLIPHFANARLVTQSVISSLSLIAEHSQVSNATTGDAGRKIRALKNKIGTWKTEWEGAEKSRERIKKWEMGQLDDGSPNFFYEVVPGGKAHRRVREDARSIVHEHLSGFAMVLNEATSRASEIMASC